MLNVPVWEYCVKTLYAGHDQVYQRHRASGEQPGWATAEVLRENLNSLISAFEAPHIPRSGRVLEVGCGAGELSLWLAAQGYAVCGVDIAPTAIEWAREKARERGLPADFQVGDVTSLAAYSNDGFDLVLDGYCLHCIIGEDRRAFLESVYRVLRPGGIFHVRTMCDDPVTDAGRQGYDPLSRCQLQGEIATRYYGRAGDLAAEVSAVGFQIVSSNVACPRNTDGQTMLYLDALKPIDGT